MLNRTGCLFNFCCLMLKSDYLMGFTLCSSLPLFIIWNSELFVSSAINDIYKDDV